MGSTYFSKRIPERSRSRTARVRPKTFKTEAAAVAAIERKGLKGAVVVSAKKGKFSIKQ